MGKLLAFLGFGKIKNETKLEDVNKQVSIVEWMYPLQIFMNSMHDLTAECGWDIGAWTLKDINEFMEAVVKMGKAVE